MNLVKPSVTLIDEPDMLKRIELAGRVCYKSEARISEDSAKKFVADIIKRGHESVLEHSSIVVKCPSADAIHHMEGIIQEYEQRVGLPSYIRHRTDHIRKTSRFSHVYGEPIFSGNARAWRNICKLFSGEVILASLFSAHPLFEDIIFVSRSSLEHELDDFDTASFVAEPNDDWHRIVTVRIVCDRGVSHELVRHRTQSFSMESTRYVKYGSDMEFVEPWWWEDGANQFKSEEDYAQSQLMFRGCCGYAQLGYAELLSRGAKPQLARAVLPNALKTEVVITGTVQMWKAWLKLRDDSAAHPDMVRIAGLFKEATGFEKE